MDHYRGLVPLLEGSSTLGIPLGILQKLFTGRIEGDACKSSRVLRNSRVKSLRQGS